MVRLDRLIRGDEQDEEAQEEEEEEVFHLGRQLKSLETFLLVTKSDLKRRRTKEEVHAAQRLDKLEGRVLDVLSLSRHTRVLDGIEIFNNLQKSVLLPTGVSTLDTLLGGGLREGQVTELYGTSPSGKTQICHCISACAAWLDFHVVYLTSNGSFSPERLVKLSRHVMHHFDLTETEVLGSLQKILSNVSVHQVSDTLSLVAIFQSMLEKFGYLAKHGKALPKVVIVDSPSLLLYRDLTSSSHSFGRLMMIQLSSAMKCLATQFNVAIVLTNHAVNSKQQRTRSNPPRQGQMETETETDTETETEMKPGLGQVWSPQVNVRVHLKLFKYVPHFSSHSSAPAEAEQEEEEQEEDQDQDQDEAMRDDVANHKTHNNNNNNNNNNRGSCHVMIVCRATLTKVSTSARGGEAWMTIGDHLVKGINTPNQMDIRDDISVWNN